MDPKAPKANARGPCEVFSVIPEIAPATLRERAASNLAASSSIDPCSGTAPLTGAICVLRRGGSAHNECAGAAGNGYAACAYFSGSASVVDEAIGTFEPVNNSAILVGLSSVTSMYCNAVKGCAKKSC